MSAYRESSETFTLVNSPSTGMNLFERAITPGREYSFHH